LRGLAPQSLPFPFAFQSLPSMPPPDPANSRSCAPGWKSKETIRFTRRREQTSHRARYGSGGLAEMENSKLANRNGDGAQIGRFASSAQQDQVSAVRSVGEKAVQKKTASRKANSTPLLRKKMGSQPKSSKLVCRYCGSGDLAPSFIKRRVADAGNVSASAMGRPHGRERLSAGSSSRPREQGPDSKEFGPCSFPPVWTRSNEGYWKFKSPSLRQRVFSFRGFSSYLPEKRAFGRNPALQVHRRTALAEFQRRVLEISLCYTFGGGLSV
jgi:hypothetical protein